MNAKFYKNVRFYMGMKEYYYEQMLSDCKLLEEEYEYLRSIDDEVLSEYINKDGLVKKKNEQYNRK